MMNPITTSGPVFGVVEAATTLGNAAHLENPTSAKHPLATENSRPLVTRAAPFMPTSPMANLSGSATLVHATSGGSFDVAGNLLRYVFSPEALATTCHNMAFYTPHLAVLGGAIFLTNFLTRGFQDRRLIASTKASEPQSTQAVGNSVALAIGLVMYAQMILGPAAEVNWPYPGNWPYFSTLAGMALPAVVTRAASVLIDTMGDHIRGSDQAPLPKKLLIISEILDRTGVSEALHGINRDDKKSLISHHPAAMRLFLDKVKLRTKDQKMPAVYRCRLLRWTQSLLVVSEQDPAATLEELRELAFDKNSDVRKAYCILLTQTFANVACAEMRKKFIRYYQHNLTGYPPDIRQRARGILGTWRLLNYKLHETDRRDQSVQALLALIPRMTVEEIKETLNAFAEKLPASVRNNDFITQVTNLIPEGIKSQIPVVDLLTSNLDSEEISGTRASFNPDRLKTLTNAGERYQSVRARILKIQSSQGLPTLFNEFALALQTLTESEQLQAIVHFADHIRKISSVYDFNSVLTHFHDLLKKETGRRQMDPKTGKLQANFAGTIPPSESLESVGYLVAPILDPEFPTTFAFLHELTDAQRKNYVQRLILEAANTHNQHQLEAIRAHLINGGGTLHPDIKDVFKEDLIFAVRVRESLSPCLETPVYGDFFKAVDAAIAMVIKEKTSAEKTSPQVGSGQTDSPPQRSRWQRFFGRKQAGG